VIDSGVAAHHPHVGAVGVGTALVGDDPADVADRLGHGTAVAAAIREKAPNAELIPVRVLDRQLATNARVLSRAIDWAVEAGVDVVNLSLGTTNEAHVPLFEQSLDRARERGVVVVSARIHAGTLWYPGALPGALGVVANDQVPRHGIGVMPGALGSALEASPYPRPIPGVPVERNLSGVSFAVANASGLIALALEAGAPRNGTAALIAWIAARTVPRGE
jgi:subtilisin family serine protease